MPNGAQNPEYEYIVVGSGAGGGPVACNLAKAGHKVLLLEAGSGAEPYSYQVPVFHGFASEDPDMSWEFFVRHYGSDTASARDTKFQKQKNGVFYPRAGTLGGCTSHNAMITVYPHNSDWDHIASLTGDATWGSDNMRQYFEKLERCGYVKRPPKGQPDPTRHGYDGWLSTTGPDITLAFGDKQLVETLLDAILGAWKAGVPNSAGLLRGPADPNDWRTQKNFEGITFAPLATLNGRRTGTRDYIRAVQQTYPQNLIIKMSNLATRVLFDANKRAIGVECLEGEYLYKASPKADGNGNGGGNGAAADTKQYYCSREVILAGGAFNTPQLLMLSGIGPKDHLQKFGINVLVDRPGVGTNLQDRYEVGVVTQMKKSWNVLAGATFTPPLPNDAGDPCFVDWQNGKGVYTTNGAVLGIIMRSDKARPDPDLFIFALPGKFYGYFPGYSKELERTKDFLTWAILKAHTNNTAGTVRLRSADPRDVPEINFRYFDEGNDASGDDLESVVAGVKFVREISKRNSGIKEEVVPGPNVKSDAEIAQFVKDNAWGHHASCSCPMGPAHDPNAVVDSNFRVYGVQNLRIVDASVFPKIPGFFIVTPIYMISEKASEVILADAKKNPSSAVA